MTDHDRHRMLRAAHCNMDDLEALSDAIRGLQSTDDPSLVSLHDLLMARYNGLKKAKETEHVYNLPVDELRLQLIDREASFDLRWKADMRAVKRWQEATGKDMEWPDHVDLVIWLLERLDKIETAVGPCCEDAAGAVVEVRSILGLNERTGRET